MDKFSRCPYTRRRMKTFLAAVAIFAIFYQVLCECDHEDRKEHMEKMRAITKQCMEEYDIPEETFKSRLPIPDDKKCFFQCVLEKNGLMDSDGEVIFESFKEANPKMPPKRLEAHEKCIEQSQETDPCNKAKEISDCLRKDFERFHGGREEHMRKMREYKHQCMEEYEIPEDTFRKHVPIPEDKKCFFQCVFQKMGLMDSEGEITLESFKEANRKMPARKMEIHEKCVDQSQETDSCNKAKEISDCLRKDFEKSRGGRGEHMKKIREYKRQCGEEYDIPEDTFIKHLPITEDKKCFFQCLFQKTGLMDTDGEVTFESFKEANPEMPPRMMETHQKCVDQSQETESCNKAQEISACIRKDFEKSHKGKGEHMKKMREYMRQCREEYDIPEDTFRKHLPIPEDKKCFFQCLFQKMGLMDADGEITFESFKEVNPTMPPKIMEAHQKCVDQSEETDSCDKAKEISDCIRKDFEKSHGRRDHMRKMREYMHQCMDEYDIPKDSFRKHLPIPDDKKCFFQCLFQKLGLMDADGEITFEKFKENDPFMSPEMVETNERCIAQSEATESCEMAKEISDCIRKDFEKAHEEHRKNVKECLEEYDLPKDTMRRHLPVPEDKKCFYRCVAVKSGVMSEDGDFIIDQFKAKHPRAPRPIIRDLEECAQDSELGDPCDSAKALNDCIRAKRDAWHKGHNKL